MCPIALTDLWDGASIGVIAFFTEQDWDYLFVKDVGHSGDELDSRELQGMMLVTTIMWSADQYVTATGWKICREAAAPVEWANWTCTVLGDDCIRPYINPNTSCSILYSDRYDEDGDTEVHDGHPLRPVHSATTRSSRVDRAVVLREKHRPTTVGFFVSTGPFTATSSALRAYLGSSSPSVATALPICAPPAAEERIPAPTEPQEAGLVCETCGAGYCSAQEGSPVCEICVAGLFSLANASTCEACAPGRFSRTVSADSCLPCDSGRCRANASSTRCTDCDIGRFADVSGMSMCYLCYDVLSPSGANPHLWTTMQEAMWNGEFVLMSVDGADKLDDCGCDEGEWVSLHLQCHECGEEMLCNGLGKVI